MLRITPPPLPAWRARAACRGVDTNLFFPHSPSRGRGATRIIQQAKSICARCPVRDECLKTALENNERGIWGGTTYRERKKLRAEHRQRHAETPDGEVSA